jgi:DNA-binding XRE family transcriptional regulator
MPVYFAQAGEDGPVKIGHATDPTARVAMLQTAHYEPLRIARVIKGTSAVEKWFHRHFRHLHIRGEWFAFDAAMMNVEPPAAASMREHPIKAYRAAHSLTLDAFAARAGTTGATISRIEGGNLQARHDLLVRLAAATGGAVSIDELVRWSTTTDDAA